MHIVCCTARVRSWQILLQKSLPVSVRGDSIALMRFATEAGDDGATQSRSKTAFLFIPSRGCGSRRSFGPSDCGGSRPVMGACRARTVLSKAWETFDRSGAYDFGYVFAIRSERALCRDVQVNLAYRWFCGLSIEDKVPDHSAFSRARNERFCNTDVFRTVFERVLEACIRAGLVGGEGFAVDASLIVADANKQRQGRCEGQHSLPMLITI